MATHTTVGSFVNAVGKYPAKVEKGASDSVAAAALIIKTVTVESFREASGGDLRLSGVGRSGAKVGVNYQIQKGAHPTATIKATGPAHLIEKASKAHAIGGRRGRGRSKALLVIGGQVVTGPVRHPGAPAKHAWTRGIEAGLIRARPTMLTAFRKALGS